MAENIVQTSSIANQQSSPFDEIRHFDRNGKEFWKARELQKLLGYAKWQKFETAIEIGIENLESAIGDTTGHLTPTGKLSTASNPVPLQDYKLSRIACYHIALACDSRGKPEVKAAKHYFACKTREAEVVIPVQNDRIRELELMVKLSEAEKKLLDTRATIIAVNPKAVSDRILGIKEIETTKFRDRIIDENDRIVNTVDTVSKTELAYRYGFVNKNGKPDTKLVATLIDEAIAAGVIRNPWHDVRVVASSGFDASLIDTLDRFQKASPAQRQLWIGE